jgi:hypothetical protein
MRNDAIEVDVGGGGRLVTEFVLVGDRWGHVISLVGRDESRVALLKSVEGSPEDAWAASPVLQNLSMESLTDGRRVALLVGMAGGSHFSASVEALNEQGAVAFDVACRHGAGPGWLGSTYRLLSESATRVAIEGDVVVAEASGVVSVRPIEECTTAGTTRWRYAVRVQE